MDENNDGAVTLESQLDYRVQRQARELYGFDENHVQVLFSGDVVAVFNDILKTRAKALERGPLRRILDWPETVVRDAGRIEKQDFQRNRRH